MELRRVDKAEENLYPEKQQVNNEKLKKNMLKKWKVTGILGWLISNLTIKSSAMAVPSPILPPPIITAGVYPVYTPYRNILSFGCIISIIISIIIGGFCLFKRNKEDKERLKKKKIIAIVFFIIAVLLYLLKISLELL